MTQEEFNAINWHRGNVVRLNNGKEYLVKGTKGHNRFLLLYSHEFDSSFVADYRIVDCRTSDYEEPVEVYLEMKRQKQAEAEAKREAERQEALKAKAERRQKNIEAQERAHQEALARKAAKKLENMKSSKQAKEKGNDKLVVKAETAPKATVEPVKVEAPKAETAEQEAPKKRVRQRIRVSSATPIREKVEFKRKK